MTRGDRPWSPRTSPRARFGESWGLPGGFEQPGDHAAPPADWSPSASTAFLHFCRMALGFRLSPPSGETGPRHGRSGGWRRRWRRPVRSRHRPPRPGAARATGSCSWPRRWRDPRHHLRSSVFRAAGARGRRHLFEDDASAGSARFGMELFRIAGNGNWVKPCSCSA
jgi:hypothetical protein